MGRRIRAGPHRFLGSLLDWIGHDGRVRVQLGLPPDWAVVMNGHWDLKHFTRKMDSFWNGVIFSYSITIFTSRAICWNHHGRVSLRQISHHRFLPNGYLAIPQSSNPVSSSNSSFTDHSIPPGM